MTSCSGALHGTPDGRACDPIVARVPFFYGWVMLPVAMVAQIMTTPGQTLGVSLFNPYFKSSLGLSGAQLSGAYMLGTLLAAVPQTYAGALMDRHGIRRTMAGIAALFGLTCLAVSQVGGLVTLFLAFFFLRMLGQGALSLTSSNTLAMWFNRRLGRVAGLKSVGVGVVSAVAPALILMLIHAYGWRAAYAILGLLVWAVMLPLVAIFHRNRPEDVGQFPDGVPAAEAGAPKHTTGNGADGEEYAFSLGEAMRTRTYWITAGVGGLWAMVGTGIIFHIVPLSQEQGLTERDAAAILFTFWICFAGLQFVGGFLADRLPLNLLMSVAMICTCAGIAALLNARTLGMAHTYAALLGASQGLMAAVGATLWVRYYGRANLGKIRGSVGTAMVACSSLGPFLMGFAHDLFGGFQQALWLFLLLFVPQVVAVLWATKPRLPDRPEPGQPRR